MRKLGQVAMKYNQKDGRWSPNSKKPLAETNVKFAFPFVAELAVNMHLTYTILTYNIQYTILWLVTNSPRTPE